ncbi:c-type cytochrome [Pseudolabrys sp. Root1462]|uniref:c-type cytochrome n=1 Tax=Pseudolabrys sp. Root1462 TaxID=1736466 RepID=UPI0009EA1B9D|nr:c-type cytochrome [Pseudolabrys sp. Root1462]
MSRSAVLSLVIVLLAAIPRADAETLLERGDYLVNHLMSCSNCHSPRGPGAASRALSGGVQVFDEPWFRVKGANITPDRDTGIGTWSDDDIKRAITLGVRPNGTPLAEAMPSAFFRILTPRDLDALVAYLRSVPAVRNEVTAPVYKAAVPPSPAYPPAVKRFSDADLGDPAKRGLYLSTVAHCMACHARTSEEVPADYIKTLGKGGRAFKGPWGETRSANITSSRTAGIGAWSDAELRRALTEGVTPDGRKLRPPMSDHVAYYRTWNAGDLDALVAWVRTIPPLE